MALVGSGPPTFRRAHWASHILGSNTPSSIEAATVKAWRSAQFLQPAAMEKQSNVSTETRNRSPGETQLQRQLPSMRTKTQSGAEPSWELNCAAYQLTAASISHGPQGFIYRRRCAPVSAADRRGLRLAVVAKLRVRLVFSDAEILLADVKASEGTDHWVGIEGRILEAPMRRRDSQ
jgi:hypothetical protein